MAQRETVFAQEALPNEGDERKTGRPENPSESNMETFYEGKWINNNDLPESHPNNPNFLPF